jgi:hypothetical protein
VSIAKLGLTISSSARAMSWLTLATVNFISAAKAVMVMPL